MTPEEAREVLHAATWDETGTWTLLRLGEDPGRPRVHELRLALRVLWRHWKGFESLPFDIAGDAALILHFRDECLSNLARAGHADRTPMSGLGREVDDLPQGAFDLLSGAVAESWNLRRKDG